MRAPFAALWFAAATWLAGPAHAQLDTRATPTYESVGLYWTAPPVAAGAASCDVRFRKVGVGAYVQGLPLWYDAATNECRGSLVGLTPGTAYEAELSVTGVVLATRAVLFTTWSNTVTVQSTVNVPSGSAQLNITSGGTPAGYVVYQGAPGILDAANAQPYNIYIQASYVVVRGFTLRGAQQHAIRIADNVTDVIIEDNDISGWGRSRGGNLGVNADSGIYAFCKAGATLTRVTIQRNEIYNPRYTANSWDDGHPDGPQAITIELCPGNHVIRHNEIFSTNGNYFNDGISGSDNASTAGFPNHDSDIYGNDVSNTWDDGIEAEGGNRNVRVWGNYLDRTGTGIASTITSVGPLYLFRNVYNRSRFLARVAPDQDDRQGMFKSGSNPAFANGRRYVFHNTMLQATGEGAVQWTLGGSGGIGGTGPTTPLRNTVTKNNIWHVWRPTWSAIYEPGPDNSHERDMYNGSPGATIVNGIKATPTYRPANGWQSESGGLYQLQAGTPGADQGVLIPNFNDGYLGAAPDVGAAEGGAPAMKFGVAASPGSAVGGGPPVGSALSVSPSSLDFGPQSMRTTSPPMRVTVTNTSLLPVNVTNVSITGPFTQANNCGGLAAGASCAIDVVFSPPLAAGPAITTEVSSPGTLTITSNDPGSPRNVPLAGLAEKSLVSHYYRSILRRAPDSGGRGFWNGEASRMIQLGADLNETWYALAMNFFTSGEYLAFNRDNAGFVTDLYNTFFNRAPDSGGLGFWANNLNQGMPREVALAEFMFSAEFRSFTQSIFGNTSVRPEVNMVVDFYRGLLARLPDSSGFNFWLQRFRAAQCQGPSSVVAEVDAISSAFINGVEYNQRSRGNAQFVGDLYNAYLRRGGDLEGVKYWIGQLNSGAQTRNQLRLAFQASPEFSNRVSAVAAAGCA